MTTNDKFDDPRLTAAALGELSDTEMDALRAEFADSAEWLNEIESVRETAFQLTHALNNEPGATMSSEQRHAIVATTENSPLATDQTDPRRTVATTRWLAVAAALVLVFIVVHSATRQASRGTQQAHQLRERHSPRPSTPDSNTTPSRSATPVAPTVSATESTPTAPLTEFADIISAESRTIRSVSEAESDAHIPDAAEHNETMSASVDHFRQSRRGAHDAETAFRRPPDAATALPPPLPDTVQKKSQFTRQARQAKSAAEQIVATSNTVIDHAGVVPEEMAASPLMNPSTDDTIDSIVDNAGTNAIAAMRPQASPALRNGTVESSRTHEARSTRKSARSRSTMAQAFTSAARRTVTAADTSAVSPMATLTRILNEKRRPTPGEIAIEPLLTVLVDGPSSEPEQPQLQTAATTGLSVKSTVFDCPWEPNNRLMLITATAGDIGLNAVRLTLTFSAYAVHGYRSVSAPTSLAQKPIVDRLLTEHLAPGQSTIALYEWKPQTSESPAQTELATKAAGRHLRSITSATAPPLASAVIRYQHNGRADHVVSVVHSEGTHRHATDDERFAILAATGIVQLADPTTSASELQSVVAMANSLKANDHQREYLNLLSRFADLLSQSDGASRLSEPHPPASDR